MFANILIIYFKTTIVAERLIWKFKLTLDNFYNGSHFDGHSMLTIMTWFKV